MMIAQPYLLFLADAPHAKTAYGVRHWRPEICAGQFRYPGSTIDLGLPEMTPEAAAAAGVKTLLIGAAPAGGMLPAGWIDDLTRALRRTEARRGGKEGVSSGRSRGWPDL